MQDKDNFIYKQFRVKKDHKKDGKKIGKKVLRHLLKKTVQIVLR